ncbi:tetratricopeptide repeat protein [Vulcanisaeta souniana]|uniref:Tetratricopeptide repeat protein n=1 Tax=Vulcanisaeta souniana JCM 11219 TaxID=1293586 RepID=A0A830EBV4_9CREN|nr:tetratricopeptide repeat protein [Vulcanisaeta souniana]BDR92743.1 hypothetical protein Vsou_18360 [Vulcanisaeta souniana JCM 11219]GGI84035.1 hypothetical protein GCM10007112_21140 [Vulcanisaeta souniana JCM 11219]
MKQEETYGVVQGNGQEPSEARRHYSRGIALLKLGRFEEALPELERALELDPGNERYRLAKVAALIGLERFEDAENELRSMPLSNQPRLSIVNARPVDDINFNSVTNRIRPIINELSAQLMRALRITWVLLVRVGGLLRVLLNRLVVRARVFLGSVRDRLVRIINCAEGNKASTCGNGN